MTKNVVKNQIYVPMFKTAPHNNELSQKNQTLSDTTEKIGQQNVRSRIFNFITQPKKNQIEKCKN